jgi:hypothetical protein
VSKRVAIIQSNYIPWKGYFNIIKCSDEFVILDDVQYTRRDWRNRNLIKTRAGLKWLSIPVDVKGQYNIKIQDVYTAGLEWRKDHWNQIYEAYRKSEYFHMFAKHFEELYLGSEEQNLSLINLKFITLINSLLGIQTPVRWSAEFNTPDEKSERLVHICMSLGADEYISGQAAKAYLDVDLFSQNGIRMLWADYSGYPVYRQLFPPFEHGVSIIDLLFNEGPHIHQFLKQKIWE